MTKKAAASAKKTKGTKAKKKGCTEKTNCFCKENKRKENQRKENKRKENKSKKN